MDVVVSDASAIDTAWVCAYYGGSAVAPSNMAADVDDYLVEESIVSVPPTEPPFNEQAQIAAELRALADRVEAL